MGIVIIILAAKLKQAVIFKNDNPDVEKIGSAAFYIMIIFGCIAVAIAFLGGLTAKCNKCFCNACFGFWSFVVFVLFLAVGIVLFIVGSVSD